MDGVSYVLSASEHIAGRLEGAILFPEDPLLSPRHANFIYRDGKLIVRDEGSANGVFVRIIKPQTVSSGATFLVGEQLLRVDACPPETVPVPDDDGTYFYGSPKRPSQLALTQLLAGGHEGMVFRARNDSLTIGREGNDVNFPDDPFISGRHATVTALDDERHAVPDRRPRLARTAPSCASPTRRRSSTATTSSSASSSCAWRSPDGHLQDVRAGQPGPLQVLSRLRRRAR